MKKLLLLLILVIVGALYANEDTPNTSKPDILRGVKNFEVLNPVP